MFRFRRIAATMAACVAVAIWSAGADEAGEAGRQMLARHKEAVVSVQLVLKQQFSMPGMGSESEESKTEVTGTVIDASGLTVLSLFATDPSSAMESMMGPLGQSDFKFSSDITDAKIMLADRTELPARVVLRDKDLDLAFVAPLEEPAQPIPCVDISAPAKPQVLDQVIVLNRLGKVANRAYAASVDRIEAVIEKPRTLYIPGQGESTGSLGSPVFTLDGQIIGLAVLRVPKGDGGGLGSSMFDERPLVVVLPAGDVFEASKQAPAQAPPEKPADDEQRQAE